jgi:20S proteasome subunit alpha 6
MNKSPYDTDVTVWSPQGRLFQVEYAMEAVKQGSCVVGLRSKKFAVIAAYRSRQSDFASYQQKIFPIDDHVGCAISGLTADGRVLHSFMRTECLNHRFVYEAPLNVGRLVNMISQSTLFVHLITHAILESQRVTQRYSRRPYGVGLLVAGVDSTGPHLYETCPSGNVYEYFAYALGDRSQSAKTYLEKHFESFDNEERDNLILHAVRALSKSISLKTVAEASSNSPLTVDNCSVAIVGLDEEFHELSSEEKDGFLGVINSELVAAGVTAPVAAMDTSA